MDFFEIMLQQKLAGGGGGDVSIESLNVTENGTYSASNGYAYNPVNINVPTGVFPSGTSSIMANGIYDITNFASVDVNVSGGGGDYDVEDGIITKQISGAYYNGRVTLIGPRAFMSCSNLTAVSFPMATLIDTYAFNNCYNLTSISFPSVTLISHSAFLGCSNLTAASFPMATSIGTSAFMSCSNLTSISFPNVTSISTYAFYACSKLAAASFPMATSIGSYAFYGCSKLTSISFPMATSIGSIAFNGCSSLTSINFPSVTSIGSGAFNGCKSLTTASFPMATLIGSNAFVGCSGLMSIYLLGSSIPALSNANAFYSTPISNSAYTGSFGSIYVPASLVNTYKTVTNWKNYSSRITAYEGE